MEATTLVCVHLQAEPLEKRGDGRMRCRKVRLLDGRAHFPQTPSPRIARNGQQSFRLGRGRALAIHG